jgi:hypothetical protein
MTIGMAVRVTVERAGVMQIDDAGGRVGGIVVGAARGGGKFCVQFRRQRIGELFAQRRRTRGRRKQPDEPGVVRVVK